MTVIGHMGRRRSLCEETLSLFDEKTLSDLENDLQDAETERRFPSWHLSDSIRPYIRTIRISSWRTLLRRTGFALLPSFVQSWLGKEQETPEKLFPTSYLDGMRGLAALFVFFCHYSYTCFVITEGFGYGEPGENTNILQLPIIRLLYSGPPMVCLFFVISGYALSLKPLKLMRNGQWDVLCNTMTSSIFRRGLRLFLPTTISTFLVFLLLRMGFYEKTRDFSRNKSLLRNVMEYHPERLATFSEQLSDWGSKVFQFVHVWSWEPFGGSTNYDVHLWTIPVEFRCSMVLFLVLMGLARLKPWFRLGALMITTWFTYRNDRWEMVLFLSGMFLAELDIMRFAKRRTIATPATKNSPGLSRGNEASSRRSYLQLFWLALGIIALYLMSQPDDHFADTPGWRWLASLIPDWFSDKYRYYQCLGSILFVLATNYSKTLQRPFNTSVVQYFGKISYAIYLVHGPVLHVIGYRIEPWAWSITGHETRSEYMQGFLLGSIFIVPCTIWAADLFWRGCDAPTVRFARWVEKKCNVLES